MTTDSEGFLVNPAPSRPVRDDDLHAIARDYRARLRDDTSTALVGERDFAERGLLQAKSVLSVDEARLHRKGKVAK